MLCPNALDVATATATAWDPDASGVFDPEFFFLAGSVDVLAVSGSTVYAAGNFTLIGGQPRNAIAALDVSTGAAMPWNPSPNSRISALMVKNGMVYVGVSFNSTDEAPPEAPPRDFALRTAWPNPTHGALTTEFAIERTAKVTLALYDLHGRVVTTLANGVYAPSRYPVKWDGRTDHGEVPAGMYFLHMTTLGNTLTSRVVVVE
jgi:hypothetical protein